MNANGKKNAARWAMTLATIVTMTFVDASAQAAGTPEQKCQAGKNDAAGKYAACAEKARNSYVVSGDLAAFDAAVAICQTKLVSSWSKLETAAVSAGTNCPSEGDQAPIENFVDACASSVAGALAGGALPDDVLDCNENLDSCLDAKASCDGDLATCETDIATTQGDLATCEAEFADCVALTELTLPKTGQSTCYNNAGSVIACAGTGQDGDLKIGATPSYTDNGNGTITDNVTGLMWEKLSDDGSIHDKDTTYSGMSGGIAKAATLNAASFAGHNDWRLPNRRELLSIVSFGTSNPAANPVFHTGCSGGCTVLTCSCTKNSIYWTSSTYLLYPLASWKLNFADGDIYAGNRAGESHYVRVVRNAD